MKFRCDRVKALWHSAQYRKVSDNGVEWRWFGSTLMSYPPTGGEVFDYNMRSKVPKFFTE